MRRLFIPSILLVIVGLSLSLITSGCASTPRTSSAPPPAPASRFDERVRADFFAGMTGDKAALDRAMKTCEEALAAEPRHAEALVWHGAGLLVRAGDAFRQGDRSTGMDLWQRGIAEEDRAVALAPNDVGVLIPRGAGYLAAAPYVSHEDTRRQLLSTGVADFEKVLALQESYFPHLSAHARGQLLDGLADGWTRLGDTTRAQAYDRRIVAELAGTRYEARAQARLAGRPDTDPAPCAGCHSR